MYNSIMKRFLKRINIFRVKRFYNRGWGCLGEIIYANGGLFGDALGKCPDAQRRAKFYVKRSNWIWNLCNKGVMFKGTK
jgi:hypothetical protein